MLNVTFRFLSFRSRSEKEIRTYLQKKVHESSDAPVIGRVIERLRELGYVDDKKFIRWWIEQRQGYKPKGMRLIVQELRAKGIAQDLIDEVTEEMRQLDTDREPHNAHSEIDPALRAIAKKSDQWKLLPKIEQKKKIYGFLGRRGFSSDVIHRVIDEVVYHRIQ